MKTSKRRTVGLALRAGLMAAAFFTALHARSHVDAQPRQGMQPPPIAFEACNGHRQGDACTVSFDSHTIEGTCESDRDQRLFCRPSRPPQGPPPQGEPPPGAQR